MSVTDVSQALAARIHELAADLLHNGHREGHEWRCGSVQGEAGYSLGVRLTGNKRGVWCDFATGEGGDALGLVSAVLRLGTREALSWSRRWLGLDDERTELPQRRRQAPKAPEPSTDPDRWKYPWQPAGPIVGTLAETYFAARGLRLNDPEAGILRFSPRRARRNPDGQLEHHPALLALLRDWQTGEPCGLINVYLLGSLCKSRGLGIMIKWWAGE
jgi:hypothetical protein